MEKPKPSAAYIADCRTMALGTMGLALLLLFIAGLLAGMGAPIWLTVILALLAGMQVMTGLIRIERWLQALVDAGILVRKSRL